MLTKQMMKFVQNSNERDSNQSNNNLYIFLFFSFHSIEKKWTTHSMYSIHDLLHLLDYSFTSCEDPFTLSTNQNVIQIHNATNSYSFSSIDKNDIPTIKKELISNEKEFNELYSKLTAQQNSESKPIEIKKITERIVFCFSLNHL